MGRACRKAVTMARIRNLAMLALLAPFGAWACVGTRRLTSEVDRLHEERLALQKMLTSIPERAQREIEYVIAQEARLATRAKHLATLGAMRSMGTALGSYQVDYNFYPLALSYLEPNYIVHIIPKDGWDNRFTYDCDEVKRGTYVLSSPGQDHAFGTPDDYVYEDGQFMRSPEPRNLKVEPLDLPGAEPPPPAAP